MLCRAFGVEYTGRFSTPKELDALLEGRTCSEGQRVLEYVLDHVVGVFPMVAAGEAINQLIERITILTGLLRQRLSISPPGSA